MQASYLFLGRPWQYDRTSMNNGVENRYSSEINEKLGTLISLTPSKIHEEQLKLKKGKMAENKNLYIKQTFFANNVLFGFDDDVILQLVLICWP